MPKSPRQLDREIKEALSGSSQSPPTSRARFTIHGARRGVNKVKHAESPAEAERIARALAKQDFLITVLEQDPHTQEYRTVMLSNRDNGKMKIKTIDPSFARAEIDEVLAAPGSRKSSKRSHATKKSETSEARYYAFYYPKGREPSSGWKYPKAYVGPFATKAAAEEGLKASWPAKAGEPRARFQIKRLTADQFNKIWGSGEGY